MTKTKTKRNARRSHVHRFKICKNPTVRLADDGVLPAVDGRIGLTRLDAQPFLFAIARDAHMIFASWNVDWRSVFKKTMPADRQVHLRVIGTDGVTETRVAVEPMRAMHFLAIPGLHGSYRVELGYFQPFDTWHSVAMSTTIEIPPQGGAYADVDLATIPFHLSFQQLASLFGPNDDTGVARVISKFQKQVLSNGEPNDTTSTESHILHKLNLSRAEITAADRDFRKIDAVKLTRRARSMSRFGATSPGHAFEANRGS
jgi:uncharacterized protein DUF4912